MVVKRLPSFLPFSTHKCFMHASFVLSTGNTKMTKSSLLVSRLECDLFQVWVSWRGFLSPSSPCEGQNLSNTHHHLTAHFQASAHLNTSLTPTKNHTPKRKLELLTLTCIFAGRQAPFLNVTTPVPRNRYSTPILQRKKLRHRGAK